MIKRKDKTAENTTNIKKSNKSKKSKKSKKHIDVKQGNAWAYVRDGIARTRECNHWITLAVVILTCFGVLMVLSAGYYQTVNMTDPDPFYYLKKQGFFAVSGLILMLIVSMIDYHIYAKYAYVLAGLSIILLVALFPFGTATNGAVRWFVIFGVTITPSELSKIFMIIFTASYLAYDPERIRTKQGLAVLFIVMLIHFALIVKQPNLSTAIVVCAIMVGIMFAAELSGKIIAALGVLAAAGVFVILTFMKDTHWYDRLTNFVNPFADAQGSGYQVSQGLIALGNGGLKGLGLGNSITKNLYLPEPQNDFILAIIGEELGFVGFAALMIAYIILLFLLIMTAARAKDRMGFYMATGVAVMLGLQVIINVAVVTASMPATGITLPFISYGGTSLWSFMIAMGIVLNVSRGQLNKKKISKRKVPR